MTEEADHLLEGRAVLPVDRPYADDTAGVGADVVLGLVVGELADRRLALLLQNPRHGSGEGRPQGRAAGLERSPAAVAGGVRAGDLLPEDRAEVLGEVAVPSDAVERRALAQPRVVVEDLRQLPGQRPEPAGHGVERNRVRAVLPPGVEDRDRRLVLVGAVPVPVGARGAGLEPLGQ